MSQGLKSTKYAADRWEMSEEHVRRMCREGTIIAMKFGSRWKIPIEANEERRVNESKK